MFFSFEGIDGSGKTTQINLVHNILTEKGYSVVTTKEPGGGGESAMKIRSMLTSIPKEEEDFEFDLLAIYAARVVHIKNFILPNLKKKKIILCDRFIESSYVCLSEMDKSMPLSFYHNKVMSLHKLFCESTMPDKTFIINVSPDESIKRMQSRKSNDKYDSRCLKNMAQGFQESKNLSEKNSNRIIEVDGEQDPETLAREIADKIIDLVSSKR